MAEVRPVEILTEEEPRKALFLSTPCLKKGNFDSSWFSTAGTLISASAVPGATRRDSI